MVIVAFVAGGMGFAAGFASHAIVAAADSDEAPVAVLQITEVPGPAEEIDPPADRTEPPSESSSEPTSEPAPAPTIEIPPPSGEAFDLFWEAWELVQRDYYGDLPSEEEMTYGAIRVRWEHWTMLSPVSSTPGSQPSTAKTTPGPLKASAPM